MVWLRLPHHFAGSVLRSLVAFGLLLFVTGGFFAMLATLSLVAFEELLGLIPRVFFAGGSEQCSNGESEDGGLGFHGRFSRCPAP